MASNSATLATTNTAWKTRTGHPTYGVASFNGTGAQTVFNIAHGSGGNPHSYYALPLTEPATAKRAVTVTSTNIVITFNTAPPSGTNNVQFRWGSHAL